MALDLRENWFRNLAELRYATTPKRIRADLDGETVLDTRDALLVWEPRRVVPWYAVPEGDLRSLPVPAPSERYACLMKSTAALWNEWLTPAASASASASHPQPACTSRASRCR